MTDAPKEIPLPPPEETAAPVVINPSPVPDATNTVLRDIAIVLAAFPILVKLIGAHDTSAILHYLQSSEGAAFLAVVVPIGLTAWRARRAWVKKLFKNFLTANVDDEVARFK